MGSNLMRARALVRDERRNRVALDRHRNHRFDLEAVREVRGAVEALMETLESIAHDDSFWSDLRDRTLVLGEREIDALNWFDAWSFATTLTACGYHSPPPPPVEELIADTHDAIQYALAEGPRPDVVDSAQRQLILFLMRARRQLELSQEAMAEAPEALARRVGRVAIKTVPVAVGLAAGTALEVALPTGQGISAGYGLGATATNALQKVLEKAGVATVEEFAARGAGWATTALVGESLLNATGEIADGEMPAVREHLASPDQAITSHVARAQQALEELGSDHYWSPQPHLLRLAVDHLVRVTELGRDHGAPDSLVGAAALGAEVLEDLRRTSRVDAGRLELARRAVDVCVLARGTRSQFLPDPTYVESPFSDRYRDPDFDDAATVFTALVTDWDQMRCTQLTQQKVVPSEASSPGTVIGDKTTTDEADGTSGHTLRW